MRLIDADQLKEDIKSRFLRDSEKRLLCRQIDKAQTIAITDRPLVIINNQVVYITDGHINALIEYETNKHLREVCDQIMNNLDEIHKWEA